MLNKVQLRTIFDVYQDAYTLGLDGIAYGVKVALQALVDMKISSCIVIIGHVISDLKEIKNGYDHNPTIKNFIKGSINNLQTTENTLRGHIKISYSD